MNLGVDAKHLSERSMMRGISFEILYFVDPEKI